MNLDLEFIRVIDALEAGGIDYAVCGGLAVAIYGFARHTKAIDILIGEQELQTAKTVVRSLGFSVESGLLRFKAGQPDEERVYRLVKVDGQEHLVLDFVLVTPPLLDVWGQRVRFDLGGRTATVVSGLIRMNELAGLWTRLIWYI